MLFDDESVLYNVVQRIRKSTEIMLSGLPATSEMEPFGVSFPKLMAVADEVVWCKADCDYTGTMETATRSVCLIPKDGQKLVGGAETYKPASPDAWNGTRPL
jgi:thymidine kinase